ncbi:MAG: Verru_Chthon cassette protein A [Verrucomicrobiota bacterium]
MKMSQWIKRFRGSNRGMALLLVLGCIVFISCLIIAFLGNVKTEYQISYAFSSEMNAKQVSESCINLVIAQIKEATKGTDHQAWASQPGMIRTFDDSGSPAKAFKLYSSHEMVVSGFNPEKEAALLSNWYDQPAAFTDLNEPLKGVYPILDPEAIDTDPAQGKAADNTVDQFKITEAPTTSSCQAPMPVRWLYLLQNGQMSAGEANGDQVTIEGATKENPIVGRIAFWTDDETCKVNINTASEGKVWFPPMYYTQQDWDFAWNQVRKGEYQRSTGHPAMVSLSAVLGGFLGNPSLSLSGTPSETDKNYLKALYNIIPRISWGGSEFGTKKVPETEKEKVRYGKDENLNVDQERLYSSVDEILFKTGENRNINADQSQSPLKKMMVDRTKFFVTTLSRAPEVNVFNKPRVTIWPIDDETKANPAVPFDYFSSNYMKQIVESTNKDQRSPFDKSVALSSTLNGNKYYFTRNDPTSTAADFTERNSKIYNYLQGLMEENVPGFGGKFSDKYSKDYKQILTEIYDYIRCVNIFDCSAATDGSVKSIAPNNAIGGATGPVNFLYSFSRPPTYTASSANKGSINYSYSAPFTESTGANVGSPPGSSVPGQVVPFVHPSNGTKGFGRFPVLSQIGVMFIAHSANQPPFLNNTLNVMHPFRVSSNYAGTSTEGRTFASSGSRNYASAYAAPREVFGNDKWVAPFLNPAASAANIDANFIPAEWGLAYGAAATSASTADSAVAAKKYTLIGGNLQLPDSSYGFLEPEAATGTGAGQAYSLPLGSPTTHPGFDLRLGRGETRMHSVLLLETLFPSPGFPTAMGGGDYRIRIKGLDQLMVVDRTGAQVSLGFPADQTVLVGTMSNNWNRPTVPMRNFVEFLGASGVGMHRFSQQNPTGRGYLNTWPFFGFGTESGTGASAGYGDGTTIMRSSTPHGVVVGSALIPNNQTFSFVGATIEVEFHAAEKNDTAYKITGSSPQTLINSYQIAIPSGTFPTPRLSAYPVTTTATFAGADPLIATTRFVQQQGFYSSAASKPNSGGASAPAICRQAYASATACFDYFLPRGSQANSNTPGQSYGVNNDTCDTIRMVQIKNGDLRIPGGRPRVNAADNLYQEHPNYGTVANPSPLSADNSGTLVGSAHTFRLPNRNVMRGFGNASISTGNLTTKLFPSDITIPRYAATLSSTVGCSYGDAVPPNLWWIATPGGNPWVGTGVNPITISNWKSGGDFSGSAGWSGLDGGWIGLPDEGMMANDGTVAPYFYTENYPVPRSGSYLNPYVMMPSAVMFGSLPTGVFENRPWQTLLFCANPNAGSNHYSLTKSPKDHLILDLFQMPVVDPYPITEAFSTDGKINMNYQIIPFTYLKRDMGLRAVLKPYLMTGLPTTKVQTARPLTIGSSPSADVYRFPINSTETLKGFEERFNKGDIFRSPSEICDISLIPQGSSYDARNTWWQDKDVTPDNIREQPYAGIYAHLTTKSNTYTVYYRIQMLAKSKQDPHPEIWEEDKNRIVSEYRGESMIERYLDLDDKTIPDYVTQKDAPPLSNYYHFRVIRSKQLSP